MRNFNTPNVIHTRPLEPFIASSQKPFMPTTRPDPHLTAYYTITLSLFFLTSGGIGVGASIWANVHITPSSSQPILSALLSLMVMIFGLYCLNRPYFLLEPRQLTVYNLFGVVTRRYTFDSWAVVKADSRRIYIDDAGITKKVPVAPWLVKSDDWTSMRKLL